MVFSFVLAGLSVELSLPTQNKVSGIGASLSGPVILGTALAVLFRKELYTNAIYEGIVLMDRQNVAPGFIHSASHAAAAAA